MTKHVRIGFNNNYLMPHPNSINIGAKPKTKISRIVNNYCVYVKNFKKGGKTCTTVDGEGQADVFSFQQA